MVQRLRAAIYARVSSEDQVEGYSLDAQLRACRGFARAHDWTVVREYVEEGRSARTDDITKRPQFKQMMEDAGSHRFDVIVVHKLDRFSRNLRVTLEHFERLGRAGVSFTSITEDMDFSSPWGRLALTLLGGLAQFYSDNLGLEVKKGKAERKAQGLYNGLLPFGAMEGEDGVPVADPGALPGLRMAFELAVQGKSDREVAVALNKAGYRTSGNQRNGPFRKDTVRGVKGGEKVYHCGGGIVYHRHDEKGLNWEPGGIRSGAGVRSSGVSQESTGSSDTWEAALCRLCLRR